MQDELFFAALNGVCNLFDVEFNPLDFVSSSSEKGPLITGLQFRKYIWFWAGGAEPGTKFSSLSIGRLEKQRGGAAFIIQVLRKTADTWIQRGDPTASTNLDLVLLSIVQLVDNLRFILRVLVGGQSLSGAKKTFLKSYPNCGRELLLKAGWCFGELPVLLSRYAPLTLLYLSTLNRRRDNKNHSRCSADECIVNRLDIATYKTAHAPCCQEPHLCEMVHAPVREICAILEAESIPLLSLTVGNPSTTPLLQVEAFPLSHEQQHDDIPTISPYVAISHVCLDGMGNPKTNALYACQLYRIQRLVNGLYLTGTSSTKSRPFWLDTLCVPLDPRIRSLAIVRMARTYLHADKVLVLDSWLTGDSLSHTGAKGLLFKILHSDWNMRLWTFHEAVLARECYFQLCDGAVTLEQLTATRSGSSNVEELSYILSGVEEDKLLATKCTMNLVRALANVNPLYIDRNDRVKYTAALPPQKDPSQELDRLIAIQAEEEYNAQCKILERWFPVLAKANWFSDDPEDDIHRLNAILYPLDLDLVYAHATERASLIRGFGFDFMMNRSEDLAGGTKRQLMGIKSKHSSLLPETVAGALGRTTSWKEDETLCLGGIIGLDLSSIAQVGVDSDKRERQEEQTCEERMKIFLSTVRKFPEAILFWPSKRMTKYPWRWAPVSFLEKDGDEWLRDDYEAECVDEGLLVKCPAIRICPNQNHLVQPHTKGLRLRYRIDLNIRNGPLDQSNSSSFEERLLELCRTNGSHGLPVSWYDFFSDHDGALFLLKASTSLSAPKRDMVLVRILRTKDDTRISYYLANVRREYRAIHDSDACVDGEFELRRSAWCVG